MKISLYTRISDLIPAKETFFDHVNDLLFNDPKRKMFKMHSLENIFQKLKQAGIEGLELIALKNLPERNIEILKKISQKYNLKILSIHQSNESLLNITINEIKRLCKIAHVFSAHTVVLHINAIGSKLFDKNFISELKKLQNEYKIIFGIENVVKSPFSRSKEMYRGKEFSQAIKLSGLAITFDTTHLGQAGDDICEFYKINKERIVNIHISDYKKSWLNQILLLANKTHLPLNEGELPIAKFLKTLKEENYLGLITMEINAGLNKLCQNAGVIKNALK